MNVNLELAGTSYKDKRAGYYPSIQEQLDLLWHDIDDGKFGETAKTGNFYTELKAVKDKYPSG